MDTHFRGVLRVSIPWTTTSVPVDREPSRTHNIMAPATMANAIPPRKKRKARPPICAKFTLEPDWRGDVGFVSEDLWKDLFGPLPRTTSSMMDDDEGLYTLGHFLPFQLTVQMH